MRLISYARSIDGTLVFYEVKTFFGISSLERELIPEDNLTRAKLKKISRASMMFVAKHKNLVNEKRGWRIDCAIVMVGESSENHAV